MVYAFEELLAYARAKSPFYRELYRDLPQTVRLTDLPVLPQADFWTANTVEKNRVLTGPLEDGVVFKSGGTTGSPKYSFFTREEWRTFTQVFGRGMSQGALAPGDRVANIFYAGDMYASFLFIKDSLEAAAVGAVHLPLSGAASLDTQIHTLEEFHATTLAGVPTSILALADEVERRGLPLPQLRKVLFGGESLYPDQRARLGRVFPGLEARSIGYASVDAGLLGFADRACAPDEHRAFPETLVEIIDELTGRPIEATGQPGKLVVTNLTRRLMPVLRYPCGDRAEWVEPAGTPDRKFLMLGRSEEGARVGPLSLYFDDVRTWLQELRGEAPSFQMIVEREAGQDFLRLCVGASGSAAESLKLLEILARERPLYTDLLASQKIGPTRVEWVGSEGLLRNPRTGKLVRLLDRRKG